MNRKNKVDVSFYNNPPQPHRVSMRVAVKHKHRKILGNERLTGVVLYKGRITRKGVHGLELVDVGM
jgi:hypothetical protein